MRTHKDKYNMQDTLNILIPVTKFRQGQIWIEEEQGPDLSPGGQHRGRKHEVKLPGIEFSPFTQHGTCPWKSDCIVRSAYATHKADEISNKDKISLRALDLICNISAEDEKRAAIAREKSLQDLLQHLAAT